MCVMYFINILYVMILFYEISLVGKIIVKIKI